MSNLIPIFRDKGMRLLTPEIRKRIVKAYKKGYKVKDIADIFDVHLDISIIF